MRAGRYTPLVSCYPSSCSIINTIMEFCDSAAGTYYSHHVELQPMPHEANIRHPGEDWAGITNQKERKRLQNRLNKRLCK